MKNPKRKIKFRRHVCNKHYRRQRVLSSKKMSGSAKQTTYKKSKKANKLNAAKALIDDEVKILYE